MLGEFLLKHRSEVIDMCITEYDEKTFVDGIRSESRIETIQKTLKKGYMKEAILDLDFLRKRLV